MSRGRKKKLRTRVTWIVQGDWCRTRSLPNDLGSASVHLRNGQWEWTVEQWTGKSFQSWSGKSPERHLAVEAATKQLQRRIKHVLERG